MFITDSNRSMIEAFRKYADLWNTDDPEWLEKRVNSWNLYDEDWTSDPTISAWRDFYVYGREPFEGLDNAAEAGKIRFEYSQRLAFTPFQNAGDVKEFWLTTLEWSPQSSPQHHCEFLYLGEWLDKFPERDNMVQLVTETMFSLDYFRVQSNSEQREYSTIDPQDFVMEYSGISSYFHNNNSHNYDYRCFCIDYFVESVRYCENKGILDTPVFQESLLEMYECLLKQHDSQLHENRAMLKGSLIGLATNPDMPMALPAALNKAKVITKQ